MIISVVVPANNEERYLGKCLTSVDEQLLPRGVKVEKIVVLNRCTDNTEKVARAGGAVIVRNDAKNLSAIKNAGINAAAGEWVVTIDADSWMSAGVLAEIHHRSQRANALGGGIKIRPERLSLGIAAGYAMMLVPAYFMRITFGLYWFRKADFTAIGGFDELKFIAEDVDFLSRLKKHGRSTGRRSEIISNCFITTSCRKFDQFGDWHFLRIFANPCQVYRGIIGADKTYLDKNWYDVERVSSNAASKPAKK